MPARLLPPNDELAKLAEKKTAQEIAQTYGVTPQAVYDQLKRMGRAPKRDFTRHDETIPWRLKNDPSHMFHVAAVNLRLLGRRRRGTPLSAAEERRLDGWLTELEERDLVAWYSREHGWHYIPKRKGIDGKDGIPIRRPTQKQLKEQYTSRRSA